MDKVIRVGFSVKPSKDSEESKALILEADTSGVTLEMAVTGWLSGVVIKAQTRLRKQFSSLRQGQVIRVKLTDFVPRGKGLTIDPKAMAKAHLEALLDGIEDRDSRMEVIEVFMSEGQDAAEVIAREIKRAEEEIKRAEDEADTE